MLFRSELAGEAMLDDLDDEPVIEVEELDLIIEEPAGRPSGGARSASPSTPRHGSRPAVARVAAPKAASTSAKKAAAKAPPKSTKSTKSKKSKTSKKKAASKAKPAKAKKPSKKTKPRAAVRTRASGRTSKRR